MLPDMYKSLKKMVLINHLTCSSHWKCTFCPLQGRYGMCEVTGSKRKAEKSIILEKEAWLFQTVELD